MSIRREFTAKVFPCTTLSACARSCLCKSRNTLGSMSIVGVETKNKSLQVVSERNLRHDFYVRQKKILFLQLRKLRIPKQTCFKTFVLLLQPSIKPFDHGTSFFQAEGSSKPNRSANWSASSSVRFLMGFTICRK